MQSQSDRETSLVVWNKLMDFRISQDEARQTRLKSFLTVEAYIMLGFSFALAQAFAARIILPQVTFLTLAATLCLMGVLLAWQSLRAYVRGSTKIRRLSRDIHDVKRLLNASHRPEIELVASSDDAMFATVRAIEDGESRRSPIKLTYIRELPRAPVRSRRSRRSTSHNLVQSPDRLLMRITGFVWVLAFVATLGVTYVSLSPSLQLAMEKAARHHQAVR